MAFDGLAGEFCPAELRSISSAHGSKVPIFVLPDGGVPTLLGSGVLVWVDRASQRAPKTLRGAKASTPDVNRLNRRWRREEGPRWTMDLHLPRIGSGVYVRRRHAAHLCHSVSDAAVSRAMPLQMGMRHDYGVKAKETGLGEHTPIHKTLEQGDDQLRHCWDPHVPAGYNPPLSRRRARRARTVELHAECRWQPAITHSAPAAFARKVSSKLPPARKRKGKHTKRQDAPRWDYRA
ncbi:hypothetical protein AUP68_11776 [Ilyonectria robusta]